MFVSSYHTFFNINSSTKTSKDKSDSSLDRVKSFKNILTNSSTKDLANKKQTPINYISKGQVQYNKTIIELQEKKLNNTQNSNFKKSIESTKKFSNTLTVKTATISYKENTKKFYIMKKPNVALEQTTKEINNMFKTLRHNIVNTYLDNDNYYKLQA